MTCVGIKFSPKVRGGRHPARPFTFLFEEDRDFSYLLGYFLGDGFFSKQGQVVWMCEPGNEEYLGSLLERYFPQLPFLRSGTESDFSSKLSICSRGLAEVLEGLGFSRGAVNKSIPEFLMKSTPVVHRALLQGLFDSDGCAHCGVDRRTGYRYLVVTYTSASLILAEQVRVLLSTFGVFPNLTSSKRGSGSTCLQVKSKSSLISVKDKVGFRLDRKRLILTQNENLLHKLVQDGGRHHSQFAQLSEGG